MFFEKNLVLLFVYLHNGVGPQYTYKTFLLNILGKGVCFYERVLYPMGLQQRNIDEHPAYYLRTLPTPP
jgi:hypothetical protein